ncbi:hypothetical protein [uncultured Sphingomonas sp.]|uniref:hypothetical protein n=1 Tax=uncultured Sphingomonas sp. TaxID=158754 RepID=UPI0025DEEB82|nr:hypothetical protein [uncultured Sphingomonas sp.]
MPLSLRIMAALGVVIGLAGLPVLLAPARVRRLLGLAPTPQLAYVLRITGAMLASLGLILIVFAIAFWLYSA